MKPTLNYYNNWLSEHYRLVVAISLLLMVALTAGAYRLTMTADFRIFFADDDPHLTAYKILEDTFEQQQDVTLLLTSKSGNIFTQDNLLALSTITDQAWQLPYVIRVTSLANYQYTSADENELHVSPLFENPSQLQEHQIDNIKHRALNEDIIVGQLVDRKGSATYLRAVLEMPDDDINAPKKLVAQVRILASDLIRNHPDLSIHLLGSTSLTTQMGEAIEKDMKSLVAYSYLIIFIGLMLIIRNLIATVMIIIVVTASVAGTLGTFGWLNYTLTTTAGFVPSILMTIAVADCVHLYIGYILELNQGLTQKEAVKASFSANFKPLFITSFTTMIGMLCLNSSDSPPYQDLGNMVAFGVVLAFILTVTFFAAMLIWLPKPKNIESADFSEYSVSLAKIILKHRVGISVVTILTVIAMGFSIQRNTLTEDWPTYFDDTFPISVAIKNVDQTMGALHRLEYAFDTKKENGIYDPEYLGFIDNFVNWARQQPEVGYVESVTDIVKKIHMHMNGDIPAEKRLGDTRDANAQLMLIYELSLPPGSSLESLVNMDKSSSKLSIGLSRSSAKEILSFENRVQTWIASQKTQFSTQGSGLDIAFGYINERNIKYMLEGTAVALAIISLTLIVIFKSLKMGLLSLIPNLTPAIFAYGLWGLLVGHLDLALSIVICMSLGIVVDDTIHFMSKYLTARRTHGHSPEESIYYSFKHAGAAMLATSVVLTLGFAILSFSHFTPTKETGTLMAITIASALILDFILLPFLLLIFDRKEKI